MSDTPKCREIGCDPITCPACRPVSPETPQGRILDFDRAIRFASDTPPRGEWSESLYRAHLNEQHHALVAGAVQQEREKGDSWKDAYFRLLMAITGSLLVTEAGAIEKLKAERAEYAPLIEKVRKLDAAYKQLAIDAAAGMLLSQATMPVDHAIHELLAHPLPEEAK